MAADFIVFVSFPHAVHYFPCDSNYFFEDPLRGDNRLATII